MAIQIEKQKWRHIPCVGLTSRGSFEISSRVVRVLRHSPKLRELDGAIPWKTLMSGCNGFDWTATWTFDWKTCLENGTSNIRFECCLDENIQIQNMRSIQGHSGGERINPGLQSIVLVLCGVSDRINHEGSSYGNSTKRTINMLLCNS